MKKLVKTSRIGTAGHYHWLYYDIDDVSGSQIKCSDSKEHTHAVTTKIHNLPQLDPSLIIIEEAGEPTHSHILTIEEILPNDSTELKIPELTDSEILNMAKPLISAAFDREKDSKQRGHVSEQFTVANKQWINNDGSEIEINTDKRNKLTINLIQSFMNLLFGHHRQNRTDLKFMPTEDSDQLIADVYTAIAKIEQNNNLAEFNENQVVEDMGITGRGNFIGYIDYDKNILGDIKIRRVPWRNVYFGEHEGMAGEDAPYVYISVYMTKAEVMAAYENEELENLGSGLTDIATTFEQSMKAPISGQASSFLKESYDINKKEYRIIELWKKEFAKIYSILNVEDGFFATFDKKPPDLKQFESLGFKKIERKREYVRHQILASESILLKDEISEIDMLPIIPVYYKKCGDYYYGKAELTLDLQRFYNKLISKILDFVSRSVNDVFLIDKDTMPEHGGVEEARSLEEDLTTPGTVIEVADTNHPPYKFPESHLPSYMFNLLQEIKIIMQTILNLNPAFSGETTAESGIKVMQNKQQALMGNEILFDNLALSKKFLGLLFLKMAKQVYTVDRVMRILENNDYTNSVFHFGQEENEVVTGRKFTDDEKGIIAERLKDADAGKLDCTPTQSPYNPTTMLANYSFLMEAVKSGQFPVPPEILIELNPIIDFKSKQKVLAMIQQFKQEQMQQQQASQQSEQEKTKMAGEFKIMTEQMKQQRNNPANAGY